MEQQNYSKKETSLNGNITVTERLTVLAEPKKEPEELSHHEHFEIYWFIEGNLNFFYEGIQIKIAPGDLVILAPRMIHRTILKNKCRYYRKRYHFAVDFFMDQYELYNRLITRGIIKFSQKELKKLQLDHLLTEVEESLSMKTEYGDLCAFISLSYLLKTAENYYARHQNQEIPVKDETVSRIIQYIDDHIASELSYKKIADHFCTSEKNIYRIFKKDSGFSLAKYITQRRIIRAKHILNQGGTAYEAAVATGYKDYSVFYRNFIKETGVAPTRFILKNK